MKFTIALLALGMTLLAGCSVPVRVTVDCAVFRSQKFSEESKEWLRKQTPPDALNRDLDRVAKNSEAWEAFCH
jgi:outer membrane murein-binding lipoprotein Lpp